MGERWDMTEATIRVISPEEYRAQIKAEIATDGLCEAVKKRCDAIDEECKYMRYVQHRYIQEQLAEILELVELR